MANALTLKIMNNIVEKCGGKPASTAARYSEPAVARGAHYLSEAIAKTGKRVETEHESAIRSIIRGEASTDSKSASGYVEKSASGAQQSMNTTIKGGTIRLDDLIKSKSLNR